MKNEPLISIIMGAYNSENTIGFAIDSIIKQTYSKWELIICDDCSTDNTMQIINSYSQKDTRIQILQNKENQRLAATLNKCLCIAKGKYIARMDSDDVSLPERLERQLCYLEEHPEIDCVGTNRIVFDNNGKYDIRKGIEYPNRDILLFDVPFAHPTIMMKRSVYNQLGGYTVSEETMRAEDLDLWFRFFAAGYSGYNMQEELYMYREDLTDFKKRTLKAGVMTAKVFLNGYKLLGFHKYKYIFALKPILVSILPNFLVKGYHRKKDGE